MTSVASQTCSQYQATLNTRGFVDSRAPVLRSVLEIVVHDRALMDFENIALCYNSKHAMNAVDLGYSEWCNTSPDVVLAILGETGVYCGSAVRSSAQLNHASTK